MLQSSTRQRRFLLQAFRYVKASSREHNKKHISQLVQVPVIFTGLALVLWSWKCLMLVVFQKKIIYMPYIARYDKTHDALFAKRTSPWSVNKLICSDGTNLKYLRQSRPALLPPGRLVTMLYLQGNASAMPARLPFLGKVAERLSEWMPLSEIDIYALSYRGYWRSRGRPSERGILLDVKACLAQIVRRVRERLLEEQGIAEIELVIWGHSIGAGFAVLSLQQALERLQDTFANNGVTVRLRIVLETPFPSTMDVLQELYPQRWLPYRYLGPFLRTRLDMRAALQTPFPVTKQTSISGIHIFAASEDEILGPPNGLPSAVLDLMKQTFSKHTSDITIDVVKGLHANLLTTTAFQERLAQRLAQGICSIDT
jgi:pimeloyl-ACP methyl ester carboxylesterase